MIVYQLFSIEVLEARERELANIKIIKGSYQIGFSFEDVFSFAECQKDASYRQGYKLTLQ